MGVLPPTPSSARSQHEQQPADSLPAGTGALQAHANVTVQTKDGGTLALADGPGCWTHFLPTATGYDQGWKQVGSDNSSGAISWDAFWAGDSPYVHNGTRAIVRLELRA